MTSRYPLRYRILLGVALAHLALVAMGASYLGYPFGPLAKAADFYGALTGSGSAYGFFAPGVSGQLRALFDVIYPNGRQRTISLLSGASHEADLRIGNIIDQYQSQEDDEDPTALQRSLSASLASTVFSRNPGASRVRVRLEHFAPVSMADWRAGERPLWKPLYEATFETGGRR
jgi:hypothetical protein